jgi:hypothetical protein
MLDEVAGLQLRHRSSKFLLRVHDDGSVPGDRLFDRLTRNQQEPDARITGLNDDLISAVEQHQRVIACIVLCRCVSSRGLFRYNRARIGAIAKRSSATKNLRKGVTPSEHARRFDVGIGPLQIADDPLGDPEGHPYSLYSLS